MSILEPTILTGLTGVLTALASLIWAIRRKP